MIENPQPQHVWQGGLAYETYMGRWSRLIGREFIGWLAVPPGADWLDVGCGAGALTATILALAAPRHIQAIDPSAGYLAVAQEQVVDPRAQFEQGSAEQLPVETAAFDAVVSGLVLNFVPDLSAGVEEMARAAKAGGIVAAYVWDYAGKMELMRYFWDAAVALKPATHPLDEGVRFPLCQPGPLSTLFVAAGLQQVEVRAIDVPTVFADFDDYWQPFLGGQFPAPAYAMSLSEVERAALRERLRTTLPVAGDGTIQLVARAWAVRGRKA
jgi:SAM-dependent methyltransferase